MCNEYEDTVTASITFLCGASQLDPHSEPAPQTQKIFCSLFSNWFSLRTSLSELVRLHPCGVARYCTTNIYWSSSKSFLINIKFRVTLNEDMHRGGSWSTVCLDSTHVLAFIHHIHIFYLDGKLLLIKGHQTHSVVHWPFLFTGIQNTGAVEPCSVCNNVPLFTPVREQQC